MTRKITTLSCSLLFAASSLSAQILEFNHPDILSFESSTAPATASSKSVLSLTKDHFKHGESSLLWKWNAPKEVLSIKRPVGYLAKNPNPKETSVSTFVFWVYSKSPIKDQKIRVQFLKEGRVCSWFDCGVDFQGWRGAWVAFDRDMMGTPEEGMDEVRIVAPETASGELAFDLFIPSSFQDVRQHTAGFQVPFVNAGTKNHWLILLESWGNKFDLPVNATVSAEEQKEMKDIEAKFTQFLLPKKKYDLAQLRKQFEHYQIKENKDGSVQGMPIFFIRFAETYINMGYKYPGELYKKDKRLLSQFNSMMNDLAVAWHNETDEAKRKEIADMYVLGARHLADQGFVAGSEMGTLHHLGYSMRQYYTSIFLMKDVLTQAGLDKTYQQAMEWFAGTGEVKLKPTTNGIDIDAFNTSLIGRLCSILMMQDSPEKVTYLRSIARWINNGMLIADGTSPCLKIDGTIYHHRHNYPAYAIGGLDNAVISVWLLKGTSFEVSQEGHENLKNALLTFRTYCNLRDWPLSLSGRHPKTKGNALIPWHFARLAMAGSPDGKEEIDPELASAYLRLNNGEKNDYSKAISAAGFNAEKAPEGNWALPYSCLGVQRRDNWMVTAMGHSRYLWATETYKTANLYGRYLNHGNLFIMPFAAGNGREAAGFVQEGWNWNHFPGTTATVLPLEELRADVRNVDTFSGYEEMLLSDETFAGALSHKGENGLFGMKLHEHDKYNGSLRARKSYFFFDNRVVALGSNIESAVEDKPTQTTLFQVYLPNENEGMLINGDSVNLFPYDAKLNGKFNYLSDTKNNYFFVKNGNIEVSRKLQHSFDQSTDKPTQNKFALASINHGNKIKGEGYEYMVLIQPEQAEVAKYAKEIAAKKNKTYTVLQKDSLAHIVKDQATQTTGYVLFEAGKLKAGNQITEVSLPCMAMISQNGKNNMTLSVADPDLRFYEGESDEQFDENGKRIERSVYSRKWINNASKESTLTIRLNGKWKLSAPSEYVLSTSYDGNETILLVKCQHAFTRSLELQKL